jgi:hypothetical protein
MTTFLFYAASILLGMLLAVLIVWGFRAGGRFRSIAAVAVAVLLLGSLYAPTTAAMEAYREYRDFELRNTEWNIRHPMAPNLGDCSG